MRRSGGSLALSVRPGREEPPMHTSPTPRKVFEGVATRHDMYRMFNRHRGDPAMAEGAAQHLFAGEWFEITEREHDYMLEILQERRSHRGGDLRRAIFRRSRPDPGSIPMQGTYGRLGVHVFASWRDVVRAANGHIARKHRRGP